MQRVEQLHRVYPAPYGLRGREYGTSVLEVETRIEIVVREPRDEEVYVVGKEG